ncbi:MAG: metallophosphoesterase [Candidatus Heimdallarchaeota archaeon]|nr:metallophosphoesterase [Candidatus Heimdallarchaeota archaeon]
MRNGFIKNFFLIFSLFLFFISFSSVNAKVSTQAAANWTPTIPDVGDMIIITYDPSLGTIPETASNIWLVWAMNVSSNNAHLMPSPAMWPANTHTILSGRFVETPMIKDGSIWEVSITLNEMAEDFKIGFTDTSGTITDNNDGNYWYIETKMKTDRILARSPSFGLPYFLQQGESLVITARGPASATNWAVQLIHEATTIDFTVADESYVDGMWSLTATNNTNIPEALYDLSLSATVSAITRMNIQEHSVQVISEFKDDFNFIHISDPQIFPDGSGAKSGLGNITDAFQALNETNAEFIVCTGDITEWTDEISYRKFKDWKIMYLDIPLFLIPGNHDEFEGTGETNSDKIWGGGQGTYELLIGPSRGSWTYGDVSFVYIHTDDRNVASEDVEWAEQQMAKPEFQNSITKILMAHHPLDSRYASETVVNPGKNDMLSAIQTYNVTHYLHGHLHDGWHSILNGVHHIGAPQTYPYANTQNNGGYIVHTVENGNLTNWTQYIDFLEVTLDEPNTDITSDSTTTTTLTTGTTPGFMMFSVIIIASMISVMRKRQKRVN